MLTYQRSAGGIPGLVALCVCWAVMALAGCEAADRSLPTVGGSAQGEETNLVAVAQSFYDCLRDHDVPAELRQDTAGRATLVSFGQGQSYLWALPDGTIEAGEGYPQELFDRRVDDSVQADQQGGEVPYVLEIDGHDYSAISQSCVESSGYSRQKVWDSLPNQGVDTSYYPMIVDASNEWAACARRYGITGVKDAVLPLPGSNDYPTALLPTSISQVELRQLLTECPNYDVTMESHNLEIWKEWGAGGHEQGSMTPGLIWQPSVGFDNPGFDGRFRGVPEPQGPSAPPLPDSEAAILEHLGNLMYILQETEMRLTTVSGDGDSTDTPPLDPEPANGGAGSAEPSA